MAINMQGLRFKITSVFILLSILVGVVMGSVIYTMTSNALRERIFSELDASADSKSNHIAKHISDDVMIINALAKGNKIREEFSRPELSIENLQSAVDLDAKRFFNFKEVFIVDTKGIIIASSRREHKGLDRSDDEYFKMGMAGKPYFKDVYKSPVTGEISYAVSAPIIQEGSGRILGVIVGRGDLAKINKILTDDTGMGRTGETYIANEEGMVITATRLKGDELLLKQKVMNDGVRQGLSGKDTMGIFTDYRGIKVLGDYNVDKDITDVIGKKWCVVTEIDPEEAFEPIHRIRNVFVILLLLYITIVSVAGIMVANNIARPAEILSRASKKIAEGDLTEKVSYESHDEIGALADNFRVMLGNLKDIVAKVQEATSQITSASSEILAASQEQASGAREQSSAVAETTSAAKELSMTSEQVGDSIKRVSQAAAHAMAGMAKIKENMAKTSAMITSLGEKSQQIGKITELIDDVADQTNLLAVNASIEAARAGEQGRGFTVVADEIRKLADSTAKSTKDITSLIELIQHEMSNSIMAMETSVTSIDDEAKLAQQTAESAREITMSTSQQISGSKQIADAMINIDDAMKQIASGAQQSQAAAKQLTSLSQELKGIIDKFRIK